VLSIKLLRTNAVYLAEVCGNIELGCKLARGPSDCLWPKAEIGDRHRFAVTKMCLDVTAKRTSKRRRLLI
jgi:hypothetical protein